MGIGMGIGIGIGVFIAQSVGSYTSSVHLSEEIPININLASHPHPAIQYLVTVFYALLGPPSVKRRLLEC